MTNELDFIKTIKSMDEDFAIDYYNELHENGMRDEQIRVFMRTIDDYRSGTTDKSAAIDSLNLIFDDLNVSEKIVSSIPKLCLGRGKDD